MEDLFTDAFNAIGPVLMMSIHVLVINCLMHNPDTFAERSVRAATTEKFKADPTFKNMMKYLIDQILMRRRTVKRSTNDWDSATYLQDDEEDDQQHRPSTSRRTLSHPNPTGSRSSASTYRRRVPVPSTSAERGSKSRRPGRSFEVSGIAALPATDNEDDPQPRAAERKGSRATPWQQEDQFCQEDEPFTTRQKKNKRPLNGPSLAKNRRRPSPPDEEDLVSDDNSGQTKKNKRRLNREVVNVDNQQDDEAELFMTQHTPPNKKHKKKRTRSPSPEEPRALTTGSKKNKKDKHQVPDTEQEVVTTSKKHKKRKNKDKYRDQLAQLIADQDEVQRQLTNGNQK